MAVALINLVYLDPATNGGLSRIAKELSLLLCEIADEERNFHPVFAVGAHFVHEFSEWLGRSPSVVSVETGNPGRPALRGLNCDLIISPLFGVEPFDQIPELRGRRHIAMMPDALALDMPHLFGPRILSQRRTSYERLKSAYRIFTLSRYSQERLAYHLNVPMEQIVPIPLGADAMPHSAGSSPEHEDFRPYVFFPANTWPHKRHDLALAAFAAILEKRPDMHLVLTGGRVDDFGISISKLIIQHRLPTNRIHDLGFVNDEKLSRLYTNAEALLFTSQHEGFGMPLLEAMGHGCPVICAPLTAIPEIAGDAALYVESDDPADWARALLIDLPKQRGVLVERGKARAAAFTWSKTRHAYKELILDIAPALFDGTNHNTPMVSLPHALREANVGAGRAAPTSIIKPSYNHNGARVAVDTEIDLTTGLASLTELLEQEKRSPWSRLPLVGIAARALIRLRNVGRFWRVSNAVAALMVLRQAALSAELEQLRAGSSNDYEQSGRASDD